MRLAWAQVISRLIRKKCSKSPSPSEWCSAPAGALRVFRGAADDVHDGHVLGVAARDRVSRREFTDSECRYHSRHSAQPSVPVGGVAGVELVGAAHPANGRVGDDVVEEFQVVVARDAEDLGDAEFGEAVQQIVADGVDGIGRRDQSRPRPYARRNRSRPDAISLWCGPWQSKNPATSSSKPVPRRFWTSSPISKRCPSGRNPTRARRSSRPETTGGPAKSR